MKIAPQKSILVPTAHDEPAIHLGIYRDLFSLPAAVAYNTEVERKFLTTRFSVRAIEEETVGCGVDLPQAQAYPREQMADGGNAARRGAGRSLAEFPPASRAARDRSSAGAIGCTGRSRSTAAGSIQARAARS